MIGAETRERNFRQGGRLNQEELRTHRREFEGVHAVTLSAIRAFSDDELAFRPVPGMRSPREILFHMYGVERALAQAVRSGELSPESADAYVPENESGQASLREIATTAAMENYARDCHDAATRALDGVGAVELDRPVRSPYGEFSGAKFVSFISLEHWHHRGQLFVYLRLLGKAPPNLYGGVGA